MEAERLHNLLLEKQLEFEACQKEAETQKMETQHLNNRIAEVDFSLNLKEDVLFFSVPLEGLIYISCCS